MKKKLPIPVAVETAVEQITSALPTTEMSTEQRSKILAECDKQGASLPYLVSCLYKATKAELVTVDKWGEEHRYADTPNIIKAVVSLLDLRGELKQAKSGDAGSVNFIDVKMLMQQWNAIPGASGISKTKDDVK